MWPDQKIRSTISYQEHLHWRDALCADNTIETILARYEFPNHLKSNKQLNDRWPESGGVVILKDKKFKYANKRGRRDEDDDDDEDAGDDEDDI